MDQIKQTTRTIQFQGNGTGHGREDPRLVASVRNRLFNYNSYIQDSILEGTQETSVACPCNTF